MTKNAGKRSFEMGGPKRNTTAAIRNRDEISNGNAGTKVVLGKVTELLKSKRV
jgi:hypothetical protein